MISATELRSIQEQHQASVIASRIEKSNQFVARFRGACDKYVEILLKEVNNTINYVKTTNKTSIILDHHNISQKIDGFSHTTLFYGFWNQQNRKFDDSIFTKNDIQRPFVRVASELEKLGYKLENISDSSRSFSLFIKLSW
jgi:hypothetical protein